MVKRVMLLTSEEMCDHLRAALDDKYITLPCSDPADGGQLLRLRPDGLILDLFLPGTNGVAFLKGHYSDLPPAIIALTRFVSDGLIQELATLGVSSVLLLPCRLTYLNEVLIALI